MLKACKRTWNFSAPKYATFWDAEKVLRKMLREGLNWNSVPKIRERLVLVFRLLHLTRSIDLSRTFRCISSQDHDYFILLRRKGSMKAAWERLLDFNVRELSPLQLVLRYVELTKDIAKEGTPLLRSLAPPYPPPFSQFGGAYHQKCFGEVGGAHSGVWTPLNPGGGGKTFQIFGPHLRRGV